MSSSSLPPFRRDRLRQLAVRDELEESRLARQETPEERLALALELADLTRELAGAAGAAWLTAEPADLPEKAHLYVGPLRAAGVKCR